MKNRLFSLFALVALAGFAACGGGETETETVEVTEDTVALPAEVPAPDTAVVTTEVTVDSTTDTTVVN